MDGLLTVEPQDGVAVVRMDDGRVNAISPAMTAALHEALDQAEAAGAQAVLLEGRDGMLSAGFDLAVMGSGLEAAFAMVKGGFDLAARLLALPVPVVVGCTGHAIAMGLFLLQTGDYRVGAAGPFKLTANEVAIGLTMPRAAIEVLAQRLAPSDLQRAAILAEVFAPEQAVQAGLLDALAAPEEVHEVALAAAQRFARLPREAFTGTRRGCGSVPWRPWGRPSSRTTRRRWRSWPRPPRRRPRPAEGGPGQEASRA